MMERLDDGRGRLGRIDIAAEDFDASAYGRTQQELMARIHGVLPNGELVEGVEVFRRAYAAVDRGWLLGWTRLPLLRPVADAAYRLFARNRLRLTGRGEVCNDEVCAAPETPRAADAGTASR